MINSNAIHANAGIPQHYELLYRPIKGQGACYAFPCDREGHVDLDALSDAARNDYLFARAVVGRELDPPSLVEPGPAH